ncbi:MAG: spinster family MFS transporter, partial [Gemmataceae bacterium]
TTSNIRATAFAINILVIHLLGDAISPMIIGAVADAANLQTAFLLMSIMIVVGGVLWAMGARHLEADTVRAEAQA